MKRTESCPTGLSENSAVEANQNIINDDKCYGDNSEETQNRAITKSTFTVEDQDNNIEECSLQDTTNASDEESKAEEYMVDNQEDDIQDETPDVDEAGLEDINDKEIVVQPVPAPRTRLNVLGIF